MFLSNRPCFSFSISGSWSSELCPDGLQWHKLHCHFFFYIYISKQMTVHFNEFPGHCHQKNPKNIWKCFHVNPVVPLTHNVEPKTYSNDLEQTELTLQVSCSESDQRRGGEAGLITDRQVCKKKKHTPLCSSAHVFSYKERTRHTFLYMNDIFTQIHRKFNLKFNISIDL